MTFWRKSIILYSMNQFNKHHSAVSSSVSSPVIPAVSTNVSLVVSSGDSAATPTVISKEALYVIVGLGKSGKSAEQFLLKKQVPPARVITFDEKDPLARINSWADLDVFLSSLAVVSEPATSTSNALPPELSSAGLSERPIAKYLVVSPGVPLKSEAILNLVKKGWQITSEINLACSVLEDEILIGITGSVGKSTVTSLLGEAVLCEDPNAFVGGNLGTPFCQYALDRLGGRPKARFIVLELSSYQLENCKALNLDYSAITYLSPNHLERYTSLEEYYKTKAHIGSRTREAVVINSASADLMKYRQEISGNVIESLTTSSPPPPPQIALIGKHNLENYLVALRLAELCHLSSTSIQAMQTFKGLSHRLETVGEFNNILFINDSKATAMDSVLVATEAALEKVKKESRLFLLLGGKDKNLPWEQLSVLSSKPQIQPIFFGQCGKLAQEKSGLAGSCFSNLAPALDFVFQSAQLGDVVLLSPGGTSLDEFKNFEDRGHFFKESVMKHYRF